MTALFRRLPHDYAARFSFLMSIPAITAAGVFQLFDSKDELARIGKTPILIGIAVAFVSGWLSIYFLLRYLRTHTTHIFIYYRYIVGAALAVLLLTSCSAMPTQKQARYLALGDSYTIGESVDASERFPVQLARAMNLSEPQIIAKTGWTTDELNAAIDAANPQGPFDLVTLLIGVNNQYRGRSADEYRTQFTALLQRAIGFAGGNAAHVIVVSIPDWGVTPFAEGRDRAKIAREIDQFNAINREEAMRAGAKWVDITAISRRDDRALVAGDGLHPSGKQYAEWVKALGVRQR
jgi:lysophospholipase L1-like esterase